MQTIKKSLAVTMLAVITATLFSFSSLPGGDVIEIYINKKMVVQQYLTQMNATKNIELSQSNYNDKVEVWYGHCGVTGKSRKIIIKDAENHVLKQLTFADVAENTRSVMSFTVKNILDLKKDNGSTFNLYYSSKELTKEKLLASVNAVN